MFTTEIRVNGALIATLHVHNTGSYDDIEMNPYEYEYFEPRVGIRKEHSSRKQLIRGAVRCRRDKGMRHVLKTIFEDIDSKE